MPAKNRLILADAEPLSDLAPRGSHALEGGPSGAKVTGAYQVSIF